MKNSFEKKKLKKSSYLYIVFLLAFVLFLVWVDTSTEKYIKIKKVIYSQSDKFIPPGVSQEIKYITDNPIEKLQNSDECSFTDFKGWVNEFYSQTSSDVAEFITYYSSSQFPTRLFKPIAEEKYTSVDIISQPFPDFAVLRRMLQTCLNAAFYNFFKGNISKTIEILALLTKYASDVSWEYGYLTRYSNVIVSISLQNRILKASNYLMGSNPKKFSSQAELKLIKKINIWMKKRVFFKAALFNEINLLQNTHAEIFIIKYFSSEVGKFLGKIIAFFWGGSINKKIETYCLKLKGIINSISSLKHFDKIVKKLELVEKLNDQAYKGMDNVYDIPQFVASTLIVMFVPNVKTFIYKWYKPIVYLRGMLVIHYLNSYYRDFGDYPKNYKELERYVSDKYERKLPLDFYSGKSFHYKKIKRGYSLWSTGWDLKNDGGNHRKDTVIYPPKPYNHIVKKEN